MKRALVAAAAVALTALVAPAADAEPTATKTLLAAGDIAKPGGDGDNQTADVIAQYPDALVLPLGDLAYESGTAQEFQDYYDPSWGQFFDRTKPTPGNHEYRTSGASGYFGYFGNRAGPGERGYYSYNRAGWHIVSLNSEINMAVGSNQNDWLAADLAANTKECILAYWHRPRFTKGNYDDFNDVKPLWELLYDYSADVALAGHDHGYQRYEKMGPSGNPKTDGIREFVAGMGGASHYDIRPDDRREAENDNTFGVLELVLDPAGYSWEFLPVAGGSYTDSGSDTC